MKNSLTDELKFEYCKVRDGYLKDRDALQKSLPDIYHAIRVYESNTVSMHLPEDAKNHLERSIEEIRKSIEEIEHNLKHLFAEQYTGFECITSAHSIKESNAYEEKFKNSYYGHWGIFDQLLAEEREKKVDIEFIKKCHGEQERLFTEYIEKPSNYNFLVEKLASYNERDVFHTDKGSFCFEYDSPNRKKVDEIWDTLNRKFTACIKKGYIDSEGFIPDIEAFNIYESCVDKVTGSNKCDRDLQAAYNSLEDLKKSILDAQAKEEADKRYEDLAKEEADKRYVKIMTSIDSSVSKESSTIEGYPQIDPKFTLLDGAYHDVDSSAVAFEGTSNEKEEAIEL